MEKTPILRSMLSSALALGLLGMGGCSSGTSPAYTPEEHKEMFRKEMSGEMKTLIDLEAKYGSDHSQVRQMKMELGLDPDRPASEQEL